MPGGASTTTSSCAGPDDNARLFGDAEAYFDSARFESEVLADIAALPTAEEADRG